MRGITFCDGHFPFAVPQKAEDGNPFQEWDGETIYHSDDSTVPVANTIFLPSASDASPVTVYGEGSLFSLRLTLEQASELYWRRRELLSLISAPSSPAADAIDFSPTIEAAVVGGHYDVDDTTWISDSASISGSDLSSAGSRSINEPEEPYQIRIMSSDESVEETWTDLVAPSKLRGIVGLEIAQNKNNTTGNSNAGAGTTARISFGFILTSSISLYFNYFTFQNYSTNLIQVGPDEFWFSPYGRGTGSPYGAFYQLAVLYQGASEITRRVISGPPPGTAAESYAVGKKVKLTDGYIWAAHEGSVPWENFSIGPTLPVTLIFSDGTEVRGETFTLKSTQETESGTSSSGTATVTLPDLVLPEVRITTEKYWTYGGIYNETTGAPV